MLQVTNFHSRHRHFRRSSLVLTLETNLLNYVPLTLTVIKASLSLTVNFHISFNIQDNHRLFP